MTASLLDLSRKRSPAPITLTGGSRSHLVTMMDAAILIRDLDRFRQARPVWDRAAEMILLARMTREDLEPFWQARPAWDRAAERTSFQKHIVEKALAHTISDKVEAAYRRGDLFEKRRELMAAWAEYCNKLAS
jgi:hypothetical protein